MKNTKKISCKCSCPYCGRQFNYDKIYAHFNKYCKKKGQSTLHDFFSKIYGDDINQAIELYKNGYSVNELVQDKNHALFPKISTHSFVALLTELGIYRHFPDSMRTKRRMEKFKNTCITQYGVENPSMVDEIKQKKCQTFMQHYGVDNIWKCDWWNDFQTKIMLKQYGTRRVSGFLNKTEEEKYRQEQDN